MRARLAPVKDAIKYKKGVEQVFISPMYVRGRLHDMYIS